MTPDISPEKPAREPASPALTSARGTANVAPMDTMKLLLGATIALLLGALVVSWTGMNENVRNAPADELARLKKQIKELQADRDKIDLEKQLQQLRSDPAPTASSAEVEALRLQLEQQRLALQEKELAERAERDAKVALEEEGMLEGRALESRDSELRRARLIADALLIGRVSEYVEDPEYGGFITFEVLMPEQVQMGALVAIRRKTGILGQLKVTDVTPEGAIASPLPGFGPVNPQVGDELILPPQF